MASFLENLAIKCGKSLSKGHSIYKSITGDEAEATAAEYTLGCNLSKQLLQNIPLHNDQICLQSIKKIGKTLTKKLTNKNLQFHFYITDTPEENAFAIPGGFIFITHKLIKMCQYNQDEIAFILAHEIGHIVMSHSIERITTSTIFSTINKQLPINPWLKKVGLNFFTTAFSRTNEFAADDFAFRLLRAVNYDPTAGITTFQRLTQQTTNQPQTINQYFATHPPLQKRIEELQQLNNN